MPRFIAFLRAINVGGRTLRMDRLRGLFEELELARVETFIASGNVIFESTARKAQRLELRIEKHLRSALGYEVATFVRTPTELEAIARYEPFAEVPAGAGALYIGFLQAQPSGVALAKLEALESDLDRLHVNGRELYWWCRDKLSASPISGARLEKALGLPATLRNSTTVRKLAAKCPA